MTGTDQSVPVPSPGDGEIATLFQQTHEPIGFDGDLPLDCVACGGEWPCPSARTQAWRLNTLMTAVSTSRPGEFVPLSVRLNAAKAAEAIVASHFDASAPTTPELRGQVRAAIRRYLDAERTVDLMTDAVLDVLTEKAGLG